MKLGAMRALILALLLVLSPAFACAEPLLIGDTVVIHSKVLGEDRRIFIHDPGAAGEAGERYPVLYLLDADRQFSMVAGQIDYLSRFNLSMPAMIVVGIDTNGYDRMRDLTPTHSDRSSPGASLDKSAGSPTRTSGGGEAFLRFLREEVRPYVEGRYRTAPYRVLAGHSLGGLITVHALLAHPDDFDGYVALSPSLWWDDERLIGEAPGKLVAGRLRGKRLFVSIAGEGGRFREDLNRFDQTLKAGVASGLTFTYRTYPDETHASVPAAAFYDAWKTLYPQWLSPEADRTIAQTQAFYASLSKIYGYPVAAPEGLINSRGYQSLEEKRLADAVGFFELNVADHPTSANAFDSLGDGYVAAGDKAKAAQAYRRALALNPKIADTARKLAAMD